ncbi:MAG: hypothetical protein JSS65_00970 [Armatimonadetes bacterium]|nr:hypothetical protein [Armatimonadota bacterium]
MLWLRILELVGIRSLYKLTGGGLAEPGLPSLKDAKQATGWGEDHLRDLFEGARYFGIANAVRLVLHVPVVVFLCLVHAWGWVAVFGVVCAFHILCVVLEVYKAGIGRLITADHAAPKRVEQSVLSVSEAMPWGKYLWGQKPWESEKFYKALGMDWFQEYVVIYVEATRLNRFERRSGEKVEYLGKMSPAELAQFEVGTRLGEFAHLVFAGLDLAPVVVCVALHQWLWAPYLLFLLWGDSWLALLQRYHRIRITGLLEKYRAREARKQKKNERVGAVTLR